MMKYIFCILLGMFLSWGFHMISDKEQETYRLEAGSTGIRTCTNSYYSKAKASIKQLGKEKNSSKQKEIQENKTIMTVTVS